MTQRSTPQQKIDDRSFPVRMFLVVPSSGFGRLFAVHPGSIFEWLDREVGRGDYAHHGGGPREYGLARHKVAFYFRHPAAAARLLEAFPELELADDTTSPAYTSPTYPLGRPR